MTRTLNIPEHVHSAITAGGSTVLLNAKTGRCYAINRTADDLWSQLRASGDVGNAVEVLAARNPAYATSRFSDDSKALVQSLIEEGLLTTAPPGPQAGKALLAAGEEPDFAVPAFRFSALIAFLLTIVLVRLPFRITFTLLSWSRTHWCSRPAAASQALSATVAIESVGRFYPGRVACLELALGAAIALALRRRHLSLVIGVADEPFLFHAWTNAADGLVSYPPESDPKGFQPIYAS
ncbi:lasso peptide biosynthesis B2 protein [Lentzea jiangxiensis]|uniref:Transglutaminase-like superfamily protein n=1 Tax=Lentzea jiangxiensis TaxID=641025 RepID=A0A1H0SEM7_9PSEU|nr:lasso peptide biosynthesis B2 protein [Lentzea jiangxiensis]SDP40174.1 Transglutaminase-like superfamily protein [Lentzea jiangxiensis]